MTRIYSPTPDAVPALEIFLSRPSNPKGTFSMCEVRGFLFAVASAPDLVKLSEWLPIIFAGKDPEFEDTEEAQQVLSALMYIYNESGEIGGDKEPRLPPGCQFRDDLLANLEPDAPIAQWCRGFVLGHSWLRDSWEAYLPDEWDEDMGLTLAALSFFASRSLAERIVKESTGPLPSLEHFASRMRDALPIAMAEYAKMGRAIWKAIIGANGEHSEPAVAEPRIGRNAPCPCGSGKKYKKCCGASAG
jgi:uncharacterized protein